MADQLSREMDPTPEALAKWIRRFRQLLGKAGIAALPVAGSLGDRIFVLEEELETFVAETPDHMTIVTSHLPLLKRGVPIEYRFPAPSRRTRASAPTSGSRP